MTMKEVITTNSILHSLAAKLQVIKNDAELENLIKGAAREIERAVLNDELLLNEKEVSERFPFWTVSALRNLRARREGPEYIKLGNKRCSRVLYRVRTINEYLESQKHGVGDERGGNG